MKPSNLRSGQGAVPPGLSCLSASALEERGNLLKSVTQPFDSLKVDHVLWVLRVAGVGIAGYQVLFLLCDYLNRARLDPITSAAYVFNVICGLTLLVATITHGSFCVRYWRSCAITVCIAVTFSLGLIGARQQTPEPLAVASVLLLLGTGMFFPWEPRWQLLFTLVSAVPAAVLSCLFNLNGLFDNAWLGLRLLSAAGIGLAAASVGSRFRHSSEQFVAQLAASDEQKRALLLEREVTMHKLANSETILRQVFDSDLDAILITRVADGVNTHWNLAFEQFGYGREEIMSTQGMHLGVWADPAIALECHRTIKRDGIVHNFELTLRTRDGRLIPALVSGALLELDGVPAIVAKIRDITSIKQTECELIAAREAALAASRAKSEFLSSISHEIRTPMHSILGAAELLDETPLDPQQREYLSVMRNNGASLMQLLSDILDLAKVESGRLMLEQTEFDPEALIDEVAKSMGVRASAKGLELVTQVAADIPHRVLGDGLRLRQILVNLLGNAIKFTEQGEVVIGVRREAAPTNRSMLHFIVRDTGIGVQPERLEEIFGNFAQADSAITRRFGGSGLGLAIVRRLAELMGGKAWAESALEGGSTFHFTARFCAVDSAAPKVLEHIPARILVIEDNLACRQALHETLATATALVELVASGNEGVTCAMMAAAAANPFDVILLDSHIPNTDSFAVARELGEICAASKIVMMLTAKDLNLHLARLSELGGVSHIIKPVRRTELFAATSTALRAHEERIAVSTRAAQTPALTGENTASVVELPKRILLSDDSADNRMLIKAFFKGLPYQIDEAENGLIALCKFKEAFYDLVLMDLQMPVMDGLAATRAIRAHEALGWLVATPIIALTASARTEDAQQSLAAGVNMHVSKPITKAALIEVVRNAVNLKAGQALASDAA